MLNQPAPIQQQGIKMKYWALLLLALILPVPAMAGACYPVAEQDAEQLVRLHSQLMVITLSCRTGADGTPLSPAYQQFTKTNLTQIKAAENTLMQWHRQHGGGNGEARMDKIRTEFHNEYSFKLAKQTPLGFCAANRDYVLKVANLTGAALTETLHKMRLDYHGRVPACVIRQAAK